MFRTLEKSSGSQDVEPNITDIVAAWMDRLEQGLLSHWNSRLDPCGRLDVFKRLIRNHGYRYARCTLDGFEITRPADQKPIINRLRRFAADMEPILRDGGGLILLGPEGTGKDHLHFALMRTAILDYGFTVEWHDGPQLQSDMRKAIGAGKEPEIRSDLAKPQILVISDILPPAGDLSDWNIGILRDVIDRRYRDCKSTWLSANVLHIDDLEPKLTEPLVARLRDSSIVEVLQWPSHRQLAVR